MAASLVTGASSDGWNFSAQLSEALGRARLRYGHGVLAETCLMKAASALTVTIMVTRPDLVHSRSAWGWLLPQPAARKCADLRNGCWANQS